MQKIITASIIGAAGVALLLGGAGTFALWNSSAATAGGHIVAGALAIKPTSSILTPVDTINRDGEAAQIATRGRHDPCVGIRGVPVVEAMVTLVLADQFLMHRGQTGADI